MVGRGNLRGSAGHVQLGLGGGYHTDRLPVWMDTGGLRLLKPKGNREFRVIGLVKFICKKV